MKFLIRKPKSITTGQIILTIVLGYLGGIYIYRPYFVGESSIINKIKEEQEEQEKLAKKQ